MTDWERAKQQLASGPYTCVLCKGKTAVTSVERGVKPLVAWYASGRTFDGFSAADKVVGKGAAFLYVLLGVRAVYANVISVPAQDLLQRNGIEVEAGTVAEKIINRRGDGICPFEEAVLAVGDAEIAYRILRAKMEEMGISL